MNRRTRFSRNRAAEPTLSDGSPDVKYGILEGETVYETESLYSTERGTGYPVAEVRMLPPCCPTKIVCVGHNYLEHARELGNKVLDEPLIFLKPPSSLIASGDSIVYPPISQRVDYEGELGVVIGRRARNVSPEEAADCIFGYTCVNDVTARDLQKKDPQFTRAKGFDTFCSVGPWVVAKDCVVFDDMRVRTFLDGEKRQDSSVGDMVFSVEAIIAYVSEFMTLEPGDLLATGTPPGVGPVQPGMEIRVEIQGVGAISNVVVRE